MVPKIDYKRQISLMNCEEFEKFISLMHIDAGVMYYTPYLDARKKKAAETISLGFHRLRNDCNGFKRLERLLSEAIYESTISNHYK